MKTTKELACKKCGWPQHRCLVIAGLPCARWPPTWRSRSRHARGAPAEFSLCAPTARAHLSCLCRSPASLNSRSESCWPPSAGIEPLWGICVVPWWMCKPRPSPVALFLGGLVSWCVFHSLKHRVCGAVQTRSNEKSGVCRRSLQLRLYGGIDTIR